MKFTMKQPLEFAVETSNSSPEVNSTLSENSYDKALVVCENIGNQDRTQQESIVSCLFCKQSYVTIGAYKNHICCVAVVKNAEDVATSYLCTVCKQEFSKLKLLHKHVCDNQHRCLVCPAHFPTKQLLRKHLRDVHCVSKTIKGYSCKFCRGIFIKRNLFYNHLKTHAVPKNVVKVSDKTSQGKKKIEQESQTPLLCSHCDQVFERKQQYEQHMLGHERYVCDLCKTSFSTKRLYNKHQSVVHGMQVESKKHKCPTCNKMFQRPFHLAVHQRRHTGEKPLQCQLCKKSFYNEQALAKHKKTAGHSKKELGMKAEKSFLCDKCGHMFYHQQTLARHLEQIHKSVKYLPCPQCEYKTRYEANLKRHIDSHANVKRFVCEICGATFHAQATLKSHQSYIHSEKRDFVCEYCSKAFKGKSALRRHLRDHSSDRPFKCHCNQSYKRLSHLKRHMSSAHPPVTLTNGMENFSNQEHSDLVIQPADFNLNLHSVEPDSKSSVKPDFGFPGEQPIQFNTPITPSSSLPDPQIQNCLFFVFSPTEQNDKALDYATIENTFNPEKPDTEPIYCNNTNPTPACDGSSASDVKPLLSSSSFPLQCLETSVINNGLGLLPESLNGITNTCEANLHSSNPFLHFPDYDTSPVVTSSLFLNDNTLPCSETVLPKEKQLDESKSTPLAFSSYSTVTSPSQHSSSGMEWSSVDLLKADAPGQENDASGLNNSFALLNSIDIFSSPLLFPNESQVSLPDTIPHLELDLFSPSIC